jgi:hypothetical protein
MGTILTQRQPGSHAPEDVNDEAPLAAKIIAANGQAVRFLENCVPVMFREVAGSATAAQFPSVSARFVMFKALSDNAGNAYIGLAGVTKADGTADATSGWQLAPGDQSPYIPTDNLDRFWRINAGDDVVVMVLA